MRFAAPLSALMAVSPGLLLAGIIATARIDHGSYPQPGYGPTFHKDLLAYSPLIASTRVDLGGGDARLVANVEPVLNDWIEGYQTGRLHSIPPSNPNDIGDAGVRHEISSANESVVLHIVRAAYLLRREHRYDQAARLLTKGMKLAQLGQRLSPVAFAGSLKSQRSLVNEMAKVGPFASNEWRGRMAAAAYGAPTEPADFKEIYDRFLRASAPSNPRAAVAKFDQIVVRAARTDKTIKANSSEDAQESTEWYAQWAVREEIMLEQTVAESLPSIAGPVNGPWITQLPLTVR